MEDDVRAVQIQYGEDDKQVKTLKHFFSMFFLSLFSLFLFFQPLLTVISVIEVNCIPKSKWRWKVFTRTGFYAHC